MLSSFIKFFILISGCKQLLHLEGINDYCLDNEQFLVHVLLRYHFCNGISVTQYSIGNHLRILGFVLCSTMA